MSSPAPADYSGKSFQYQVLPAGKTGGLTSGNRSSAAQRLCEQSGTYIGQHGGWLASWGPRVVQSCLATAAEGGVERLAQATVSYSFLMF